MKDFLIAFGYPIKGLRYTFSNKPLLRIAMIPIVMNLVFFILSFFGFHWAFNENVFPLIEFGEAWYYSFLEYFLVFLAWLLLILSAAITAFLITNILSALVFDVLARKTETLLTGVKQEDAPFSFAGMVEPAIAEIQRYGLYFVALIVILPLNFLPVIGHVLYFGCFALISSFFFAYEFFDHTLSRRNIRFKDKKTLILDTNRGSSLGFGFGVFLLFLIPFAAIVVVPASVVGATLLICERMNDL